MRSEKLIFHIDVNSAFLSWSALERLRGQPGSLDLRTVPAAVGGDDVAAFFDGRFPGTDGHVVQMQVVRAEQWAFAAEFHVFYQLHCIIVFKVCDFRSRIWLSYVSIPIIYVQSYANIMD